jgi:hypothetical protein
MSALPLSQRRQAAHAYPMRQNKYQSQGAQRPMQTLRSLASRIAAVISECNYAQRRMLDLNLAPGRHASGHDRIGC